MDVNVKGVHYHVSDTTKEFIDKKLVRLDYVKEMIVDLPLTIIKEKKGYRVECDIHFRWGSYNHIHTEDFDLYPAIEKLFDKIETKATREKDKIQAHS